MAIPHYPYMILKMSGPQGIITARADFQGAAECFWGAIQTTLIVGPSTALPTQANTRSEEEGLTIPTNETQAVTSIRSTEGEYPLGHIYLSITFRTPENYRTEFLRFEMARFDCGYNAIIGRPGLAKFMAIPDRKSVV